MPLIDTQEGDRVYDGLASELDGKLQEAFDEAIEELRGSIRLEVIEDAIDRGGVAGAMDLLSREEIREYLGRIGDVYQEGAMDVAQRRNREIRENVQGPAGRIEVVMEPGNPLAAQILGNQSLDLIREIGDKQEEVIRNAVSAGLEAGKNPRDVARDFRDAIGLTERQEKAVRNFRRMLEEGDREALTRELRDKRFDATIRDAIEGRRTLSQDKIDRMVDRYRQRYLKYRRETIARTESLRALSQGKELARDHLLEQGALERSQVRRYWITARDERVRNYHRRIPMMNSEGVAPGEPFKTPLGDLRYPRDPLGSGRNTINCRCSVRERILDYDEVV